MATIEEATAKALDDLISMLDPAKYQVGARLEANREILRYASSIPR